MNKFIRIIFLPIMILAGIFTGTMCTLIFAPILICHWWRERRLIPEDLARDEEYLKKYHHELAAALQNKSAKNNA